MTASDSLRSVFNSEILHTNTVEGLGITIFANDLVLIEIGEFQSINKQAFEQSKAYFHTLGSEKRYHFIFKFESFADVDPDMRKKRATKEGTDFSLSDAVVITNLPQKILGDFYMRINRPVRPTKIFFSLEKAVAWSKKQQKKRQSLDKSST